MFKISCFAAWSKVKVVCVLKWPHPSHTHACTHTHTHAHAHSMIEGACAKDVRGVSVVRVAV